MPKRTSKGKENGFVALKMRVDELTGEVKQLKEERENCAFKFDQVLKGKRVCFVPVANRWKIIDSRWPCCENKCVNTDRPDVYCIKGNGYIQIKSDTYIKWINRRDDGSDKTVVIQSENLFNKPNEISASQQCFLDFITYSLFYYEVELQLEKAHHVFAIGLKNEFGFYVALLLNNQLYYFIKNKSDYIYFPKFNYKTGDVFGCGLVYPPPKMKDKLPYVFFTQNGKQIGKAISLKENCEYLNPYVQLENCSLETNFDSDFQPFVFDVSKYYVSEEFYNDEEFSGTKNQKIE